MIKKFFIAIVTCLSITIFGSENPSGISNKGNTCYMNAALQCLYNVNPLTDFLLAQKNTQFYLENETITIGRIRETVKTVAYEYTKLIEQLKNSQSSPVDPIIFCTRMWQALDSQPGVQGDADEFISVILDRLIDGDIRKTLQTNYYGFPFNYIPKGMPGDLFYGIESSVLLDKRTNLNRPLTRRENALYNKLAISITKPIAPETSVSLEDCLNNYFATTTATKNISKKLEIIKLAPYIIITLKRLTGDDFQPIEKIDTPVKLPISTLNMKPYLSSDSPETDTTYELISLVQHGGSSNSGHYNAYIKYNQEWFFCDDSSTTKMDNIVLLETVGMINRYSPNQFFTPYILFYKKINPDSSANFAPIVSEDTLGKILSDKGISEQMLKAYLMYKTTTLKSLVDGINQRFITANQLKGYILDENEEGNLKKFYSIIDVITLLDLENALNILEEM